MYESGDSPVCRVEHMQWRAEQIFSDNTYIHDIHDFTQKQTIFSVKIHSPVLFL